jgi:hypothetical protein
MAQAGGRGPNPNAGDEVCGGFEGVRMGDTSGFGGASTVIDSPTDMDRYRLAWVGPSGEPGALRFPA